MLRFDRTQQNSVKQLSFNKKTNKQKTPQRGITSHQAEWPLPKNLQPINAEELVEKREPSYTIDGNVGCYNYYREQIPLLGVYPGKIIF